MLRYTWQQAESIWSTVEDLRVIKTKKALFPAFQSLMEKYNIAGYRNRPMTKDAYLGFPHQRTT